MFPSTTQTLSTMFETTQEWFGTIRTRSPGFRVEAPLTRTVACSSDNRSTRSAGSGVALSIAVSTTP